MKNAKKFFGSFENLKSASLISINNYEAKTSGEIANHVVNVNISVHNAKETDLNRLKNCNDADVQAISKASGIEVETVKLALSEMLASAEKNLSANLEDRTNQSKGQSDAYINLTPAIRLHKETLEIHVFGQAISKVILKKGEYKTVNSSAKTLAKQAITKHLDLRAGKFRDFICGRIDTVKVKGETIEL
jgi:hypothetical protein